MSSKTKRNIDVWDPSIDEQMNKPLYQKEPTLFYVELSPKWFCKTKYHSLDCIFRRIQGAEQHRFILKVPSKEQAQDYFDYRAERCLPGCSNVVFDVIETSGELEVQNG